MAKERLFDLPETKGAFQLKGVVTGTEKDNFSKDITTKSGKAMKAINFGVTYDTNKTLYVNLQGMEQDNVYFSKKADKPGEKGDTQKVAWGERFKYNREGYKLIGNNIGVKKKVDENGKTVNDKKVLTDFDSCVEISNNLKDDQSVFVRGKIDYSSYTTDKGDKRTSTKLVPNQVSLCADCDFTAEDYEKTNDFNQVIVFTGIEQEKENDKPTGRFVVSAKVVTWGTIEDVEFIIENKDLANKFKKSLKPYWAIKVSGHIISETQTETVADDDDYWGEADSMQKVITPNKRLFVITGADGSSIEREMYSEEKVNAAIAKINQARNAESNFGSDDSWGDTSKLDSAGTDEDVWD